MDYFSNNAMLRDNRNFLTFSDWRMLVVGIFDHKYQKHSSGWHFKTNLSSMVLLPCKSDLTMSYGMSVADRVVIGTDVPDPLDAGLEKFVYMSIVRTASDVLKRSASSEPFTVNFSHKTAKRLWNWVLEYKRHQIRRLGINVTHIGNLE